MNIDGILREIEAEIRRLVQARDLIAGHARRSAARETHSAAPPAKRRTSRARRTISPEGRARIAAAQKRRWAKQRRAKEKS